MHSKKNLPNGQTERSVWLNINWILICRRAKKYIEFALFVSMQPKPKVRKRNRSFMVDWNDNLMLSSVRLKGKHCGVNSNLDSNSICVQYNAFEESRSFTRIFSLFTLWFEIFVSKSRISDLIFVCSYEVYLLDGEWDREDFFYLEVNWHWRWGFLDLKE